MPGAVEMPESSNVRIAVVVLRWSLPAETLKEKRTIVKSMVERIRNRFNATCAEIADLDSPDYATIAAACISNNAQHADRQVQEIARVAQEWRLDAVLIDIETEIVPL
jgi:uncharacterized protein YlxP (DUF503 family)